MTTDSSSPVQGDWVSRQAVLDAIGRGRVHAKAKGLAFHWAQEFVKELPSLPATQKTTLDAIVSAAIDTKVGRVDFPIEPDCRNAWAVGAYFAVDAIVASLAAPVSGQGHPNRLISDGDIARWFETEEMVMYGYHSDDFEYVVASASVYKLLASLGAAPVLGGDGS